MLCNSVDVTLTSKQISILIDLVREKGSRLIELKKEAKIRLDDNELKEYIEEELDAYVGLYANLVNIEGGFIQLK